MPKPTKEPEYPTHDQLLAILKQAKISHAWMLKSICWKEDQIKNFNYSSDLKHAIAVDKLLNEVKT